MVPENIPTTAVARKKRGIGNMMLNRGACMELCKTACPDTFGQHGLRKADLRNAIKDIRRQKTPRFNRLGNPSGAGASRHNRNVPKGRNVNSLGRQPTAVVTRIGSTLQGSNAFRFRIPQVSPAAIQVEPLRGHPSCDGVMLIPSGTVAVTTWPSFARNCNLPILCE
jgi:hypothetical protein